MAAPYALLTVAEAKAYCGLTSSSAEDDALLDTLIDAASLAIEDRCMAIMIQRTEIEYRRGATKYWFITRPPLVSVTSIVDPAGNVIAATDYIADVRLGKIEHFSRFPQAQETDGQPCNWTVTYVCGKYASQAAVPQALKIAAARFVSWLYERRSPACNSVSVGSLSVSYGAAAGAAGFPEDIDSLLGPYCSTVI